MKRGSPIALVQTMLKPMPLLDKNEIHDLKVRSVLPILSGTDSVPLGAHNEATDMLLRFNPRLIGFGIASPSPNPCPGMSAPIQLVRPFTEKNSEEEK